MTEITELNTETMLNQMRSDINDFRHAAELVLLNRMAFALIVAQQSPVSISDEAAMKLVEIVHDMLTRFADDMNEALEQTEAGKVTPEVHRIPIDGETKH